MNKFEWMNEWTEYFIPLSVSPISAAELISFIQMVKIHEKTSTLDNTQERLCIFRRVLYCMYCSVVWKVHDEARFKSIWNNMSN